MGLTSMVEALMDVNFIKRPPAESIRSALTKAIHSEIEVQEVSNSQEVLISTDARNEQALEDVRRNMIATLNSSFNPQAAGKADINTVGQVSLADALRDPLAKASVGMPDDQLMALSGENPRLSRRALRPDPEPG